MHYDLLNVSALYSFMDELTKLTKKFSSRDINTFWVSTKSEELAKSTFLIL